MRERGSLNVSQYARSLPFRQISLNLQKEEESERYFLQRVSQVDLTKMNARYDCNFFVLVLNSNGIQRKRKHFYIRRTKFSRALC